MTAKNKQPIITNGSGFASSDTAKAIFTVIAVLLIPGAVLAWNYASNRNAANENDDILNDGASVNLDDSVNLNPDGTNNNNPNNGSTNANPDNTNNGSNNSGANNGKGGIGTLPNTSSAVKYTVKKGDTAYSISMDICEDDSFYRFNKSKPLNVNDEITVRCE